VARQEAHFSYAGTTAKVATVRNNDIIDTGDNLARRRLPRLQANSVGYHTVTYDAAGNELSYVATRTYSARNLLEAVREPVETGSAQHRVQYEYDGRGIRLTRNESWGATVTGTTRYVYSPELQLLASTGSTGAIRHEFLSFGGRPLAQVSTDFTGPRWYFTDHLGTPILQTDQNAATAWRVEYEPYGEIYRTRVPEWTEENPIATPDQPLRFPGQEAAMNWEGTEERYNIFRWYRAGWGRYTQVDPLGLQGSDKNLYRYALSNPVRFADPTGSDVRLCCRPVNDPVLKRWDHCYIESNTNSRRETWGLYNVGGEGHPLKNNPADNVASRCTRWFPETCEGNKCWTLNMNKYPVEDYSEVGSGRSYFGLGRGDGRNSNTFANCLWGRCGPKLGPGDLAGVTGLAPGWDQPCPAF
jgi:RHS repeat-associated protein